MLLEGIANGDEGDICVFGLLSVSGRLLSFVATLFSLRLDLLSVNRPLFSFSPFILIRRGITLGWPPFTLTQSQLMKPIFETNFPIFSLLSVGGGLLLFVVTLFSLNVNLLSLGASR